MKVGQEVFYLDENEFNQPSVSHITITLQSARVVSFDAEITMDSIIAITTLKGRVLFKLRCDLFEIKSSAINFAKERKEQFLGQPNTTVEIYGVGE